MRKNLHYKVLASVLAIAGLYFYNAPAAWADDFKYVDETTYIWIGNGTIDGNKVDGIEDKVSDNAEVYGWYGMWPDYGDSSKKSNNNVITIKNSTLSKVTGGHTEGELDNYDAKNNTVNIENSNISTLVGGYSMLGTASGNKVSITNTDENKTNYFDKVAGGTTALGETTNNTVTINGNVTASGFIAGGVGEGGYSQVYRNQVIIQSGTVTGNIYGGYGYLNSNALIDKNDITITGSANVAGADLYGGYADNTQATISNNTLTLNGWSGSVKSVQNFSDINFENIKWENGGTVLNITNNTEEKALADTNINVNSIAGGSNIAEGDTMTLITGDNLGVKADKITINPNFYAGVATEGTGSAAVNADGSVTFTVDTLKAASQTKLVAENRAVAAAFINQGTDLISDSLDTLSRDGNYGVKTFAAVHGNRSKYDVNSDLKINGWSTIVGVGNAAEFADGDEFSWGVFYENGSGNYRTYNEFNNEFFRGDGSLVYNGGGIAARYENANGVYTEGSLRAGMLKSEMDDALRDGSGNYYGYDSESAYYGAHIGVGKIISLSESSDLDVYGKFFHTYTEGDSFTVEKDKFEFDSITSDRLRIGARVNTNKANAFSTYYGLAYEYEFNGDADMRAQNLKAPTQSLQGSSYMAEVGFNYQPTPDSPWSFDLNMRGYAGEREGASFNVQATYTF